MTQIKAQGIKIDLREQPAQKKPTEGVIAIDNGGKFTKVVTANSFIKFPSEKGEYRERSLVSTHGRFDYIVELEGRKYMCGSLAVECEFPIQMHSDTKQHLFYDLSVLIACHQFGYEVNYVVISIPIYMNTPQEKVGLISRLKREWTVTVNGETRTFVIADVKVAPETVTAFWVTQPTGLVRWVDWGSRTIGYGTTINDGSQMRYLDAQSGTFSKKGLEAIRSNDYTALVDFVAGKLLSMWDKNDRVIHTGGGALVSQIIDHFRTHFPYSEVHENPQLAQAFGMYALGREVYGRA